jgi:hypothetical protein
MGGIPVAASAQVNFAAMKARAAGLTRVAITVGVTPAAADRGHAVDATVIQREMVQRAAAEGAQLVSREQADPSTLLVTFQVTCSGTVPSCSTTMLYSRLARVSGGAPAEVLVGLMPPAGFAGASWHATATQLGGYASEGAFAAAQFARPRPR